MNPTRQKKIIAAIVEKIQGMLEENAPQIFADYEESYQAHDAETEFKFNIGMKAVIVGGGNKIQPGISWSLRRKYDCEVELTDTPDMFEKEGATE